MDQQLKNRRLAAVKAADAINAIEGFPVSDYIRSPSGRWAAGKIVDHHAAVIGSYLIKNLVDDTARNLAVSAAISTIADKAEESFNKLFCGEDQEVNKK